MEVAMLGTKSAAATIAVRNISTARAFYEGTLGLTREGSDETEAVQYRSGDSLILVYKSQYAGTNKATAATWTVGDDLDRIVETLKAKDVTFEHYDLPETAREGDIHVSGPIRVAWLKDPDGNVLALVNQ